MKINEIIKAGKSAYEIMRITEQKMTKNEKLLFEACYSLGQLKKALEEIINMEDKWDNCIPKCNICWEVQKIARWVLKDEDKPNIY